MEVEREIVDIYRCVYMIDHVGERFEGTVSAFVGTGAFVTLDEPFVDVLVRIEDMGADYQIEDDGLMATSSRSGDSIRLGDRMLIDVTDCAILRRTVYAKRVRSEADAADDVLARREGGGGRGPGAGRGGSPSFGARGPGKGAPSRGRAGGGDRGRGAQSAGPSGGGRGRGGPAASTSGGDRGRTGGPSSGGGNSGGSGGSGGGKGKKSGGRKVGKKGKRR